MNIEVKKVEGSQNQYEFKIPYIVTDEYGAQDTLYRKEIYIVEDLNLQKQELLDKIAIIDEKLNKIQIINDSIE